MNNYLKTIEIKNFKCFKDFKADGLKRVNLIGGKNNVGKTAFMEACYINLQAMELKSFVFALRSIKEMRENLNILFGDKDDTKTYIEQLDNIFTKSNLNLASFKIKDELGIKEYLFEFNKQHIKVNTNNFSYEMNYVENIVFIDNFGLSNREIISFYSAIQRKKEEQFLNTILKNFDDRIESFKIIDNKPTCEIDSEYYEITEFGDGVRHLISIVTALFTCEDGYLFIDEVDNGIHYTQLDEIWTIILEVSKKLNVQIFATTHSKECISSFNKIQTKLQDKDTYYFEMVKNIKTNKIYLVDKDANQLFYELTHGEEVRG